MNTEKSKFSVRIDTSLVSDFDKIAEESKDGKIRNDLIEEAMRYYRDRYYMQNKASIINDNILSAMQGISDRMEMRLNHKTNQLLSELAIQVSIMEQILGASIPVDGDVLSKFRQNAVEFIKVNQRIFRMDEVIE